jgi:hypothetical protein
MAVNVGSVRIAIEDEDGKYRILTKITPTGDGGFAVMLPPHRAKEVFLLKLNEGERHNVAEVAKDVLRVEQKERYSADDRIKLSFQEDGFFHFVSENPNKTLSARNAAGDISGLGIVRGRLSSNMGATIFSILAWGLSEFEECTDSNESNSGLLRFFRSDLYNRGHAPTADPNGIAIDGVLFHSGFWEAVQGKPPQLHLQVAFRKLQLGFATIDVRAVPLESADFFLGIFANNIPIRPPSPSGFSLFSQEGTDKSTLLGAYPDPGDVLIKRRLSTISSN